MSFEQEITRNTPSVKFVPDENYYCIKGKCFPENSRKFFMPIEDWVHSWRSDQSITISMTIDYLSSASSLGMVKVINTFVKNCQGDINILWHYEEGDEEALKTGEMLNEATDAQFEFRCVKEEV